MVQKWWQTILQSKNRESRGRKEVGAFHLIFQPKSVFGRTVATTSSLQCVGAIKKCQYKRNLIYNPYLSLVMTSYTSIEDFDVFKLCCGAPSPIHIKINLYFFYKHFRYIRKSLLSAPKIYLIQQVVCGSKGLNSCAYLGLLF